MKTLQYSNVETFIVFRSSTPLLISFCDYFFLGRQMPSRRSWLSLIGLLSGAVLYVKYDSAFDVRAYIWVALWFAVFTFDQVRPIGTLDIRMGQGLGRQELLKLCREDEEMQGVVPYAVIQPLYTWLQ